MQTLPNTPPDYYKNTERAGDLPTCIICGRGIKDENPKMVHVHSGGVAVVHPDQKEPALPPGNLRCRHSHNSDVPISLALVVR